MITSLKIIKYKCYTNTTINFKKNVLLVGENNAGKSCLVETLKIISAVSKKVKNISNYRKGKDYFNFLDTSIVGVSISVKNQKIELRNAINGFGTGCAQLIVSFSNNIKYHIYINTEYVFAVIKDASGHYITRKKQIDGIDMSELEISVMPQLSLIRENEKLMTKDTVEKYKETYLTSLHFRNEILAYKDNYFENFKQNAESIWKGLSIENIEYDPNIDEFISLLVRDNDFVSEIGLMGSGLQIWLQMIWFITKTPSHSTLILDEPDIYLHPDLQGKILKLINYKFNQTIIATHSIELISSIDPSNLLILDKKNRLLKYANSPMYAQKTIENLGSVQNLSLLRLSNAKKCIFVEGNDIKLLEKFKDILYPSDYSSLNDIPCISLGGFSHFKEIIGTAKLFENETKGEIKTFCILDRDYHLEEELTKIREISDNEKIYCHIWNRKEIESYIFNPNVLYKFLSSKNILYNSFCDDLNNELDCFKEQIIDEFATSIQMFSRKNGNEKTAGTASLEARNLINTKWKTLEEKAALINGKQLIKFVCKLFKDKYNISLTTNKILSKFTADDVDLEIKSIIDLLK